MDLHIKFTHLPIDNLIKIQETDTFASDLKVTDRKIGNKSLMDGKVTISSGKEFRKFIEIVGFDW